MGEEATAAYLGTCAELERELVLVGVGSCAEAVQAAGAMRAMDAPDAETGTVL